MQTNIQVNDMKNRIIGIYSLVLGIAIIGMWLVILSGATLPEGRTELSFHLASEFLMATFCIVSGILVLRRKHPGRLFNMAALGMMIYSVLNAAGYYGERGEKAAMIMFIVVAFLSLVVFMLHFPAEKEHQ
jgi:membrane protein implicated in regulation of membrane protease activity